MNEFMKDDIISYISSEYICAYVNISVKLVIWVHFKEAKKTFTC